MGQSQVSQDWRQEYQIVKKDTLQPNRQIVKHKIQENKHQLISLYLNDEEQIQGLIERINKRQEIKSKFVVPIQRVYNKKEDKLCGSNLRFQILTPYPHNYLYDHARYRKIKQQYFYPQEIMFIVYRICMALKDIKLMQDEHGNITMHTIIVSLDVLLEDPIISQSKDQESLAYRTNKVKGYPSPAILFNQYDSGMKIDKFKEDLFSVGIVALQLINLQTDIMNIYNGKNKKYENPRVDFNLVSNLLHQIRHHALQDWVTTLLHQSSDERLKIFQKMTNFNISKNNLKIFADNPKTMTPEQQLIQTNKPPTVYESVQYKSQEYSSNGYPRPELAMSRHPSHRLNESHSNQSQTVFNSTKISLRTNPGPQPPHHSAVYNFKTPPSTAFGPVNRTEIDKKIQPRVSSVQKPFIPTQSNAFAAQSESQTLRTSSGFRKFDINYAQTRKQFDQYSRINNHIEQSSNNPLSFKDQNTSNVTSSMAFRPSQTSEKPLSVHNYIDNYYQPLTQQQADKKDTPTPSSSQLVQSKFVTSEVKEENKKVQKPERPVFQRQFQSPKKQNNNTNGNSSQTRKLLQKQMQQLDILTKKNTQLQNLIKTGAVNMFQKSTLTLPYQQIRQVTQQDSKMDESFMIQNYQDGTKYQGFKRDHHRNGYGKFYYKDGSLYDGQWRNNYMEGYGTLYYPQGKIAYQGHWKKDQFDGKGIVNNDNPQFIKGNFNYTDFTTLDNDQWQSYDGNFTKSQKNGQGKWILSNGQYYVGEFVNDLPHGSGVFVQSNGNKIKGIWGHGKLKTLVD